MHVTTLPPSLRYRLRTVQKGQANEVMDVIFQLSCAVTLDFLNSTSSSSKETSEYKTVFGLLWKDRLLQIDLYCFHGLLNKVIILPLLESSRREEVCRPDGLQDFIANSWRSSLCTTLSDACHSRPSCFIKAPLGMRSQIEGAQSAGATRLQAAPARPCCYLRTHVPCLSRPERSVAGSLIPNAALKGITAPGDLQQPALPTPSNSSACHEKDVQRTDPAHRDCKA
jgi:hypothetical protein